MNARGRFSLTFNGRGGVTRKIRSSTDLQNWNAIGRTDTVRGTTSATMNWTARTAPGGQENCYRLKVP